MHVVDMTKVSSKIFVGTKMTAELRPLSLKLTVVEHEEREYLGRYTASEAPTLSEVRALCEELSSLFYAFKAEIPSRAPQIVVFPQVFIG